MYNKKADSKHSVYNKGGDSSCSLEQIPQIRMTLSSPRHSISVLIQDIRPDLIPFTVCYHFRLK
jgi:hypothetical protein